MIEVPDTNIKFTKREFSGLEYREFVRENATFEYLDEIVEATLTFVIDKLQVDGKAVTDQPMSLNWEQAVLPLYFAVAKTLVPKAPAGTISEDG